MKYLLPILLLTPLIGFLGCLIVPRKHERVIFWIAISVIWLEMALLSATMLAWIQSGAPGLAQSFVTLFSTAGYSLKLEVYFDQLAAIFLSAASIMTGLVFLFSKYYMHREPGFKRFYTTLYLFLFGLSLIILAGNFETLFLGWEVIGMSSILLIAFYRDRFLPARNALKVFSVYRVADAFLLVAILYAHHVFAGELQFSQMGEAAAQYGNAFTILGLCILAAALIKSAQYPFSYWLPRAMEGPTTSSAIFYGALSVHMGVFLLLRTFPLWEGSLGVRLAVAGVGLTTALVASAITRVQSSIKSQIAYASITQIGIMFIEVAAGLHWLVLLHFISNASLRTYQLLISPSIVSYLVHEQFFSFVRPAQRISASFAGRIRATYYILSIKEWDMNTLVSRYIWGPLKRIGRTLRILDQPAALALLIGTAFLGCLAAASGRLEPTTSLSVSTASGVIAVLVYIRAYTTKRSALVSWNQILVGHVFGLLFLGLISAWNWLYVSLYAVPILIAYAIGSWCLRRLKAHGESLGLWDFNGSVYSHPRLSQLFFIICLVYMSFPISTAFVAQDVMLSFIHGNQDYLMVLYCAAYLLSGVSIMRLYAKLFFGPHKASYHEIAYKSA